MRYEDRGMIGGIKLVRKATGRGREDEGKGKKKHTCNTKYNEITINVT